MPMIMNQRGFWQLDEISDQGLVGSLNALLITNAAAEARIVAHLAELDARRLHLKHEPSLFQYCQKRLGLSDNQAYYRIAAARIAREFPVVFGMLERGEIHLTNLAPLTKYLTREDHAELLHEAGRLSKRELLRALARRAPRPDVPSQIRKLRPQPGAVSAGPTGSLEPLSASSYRLQLNTSATLKDKLELARDLMSHANPTGDLAVVVERALDLLIEKLHQQRFGQTARPRRPSQERQARSLDRSKPARAHARSQPPSRPRSHIPNETRRGLVARDGLCCSHVDEDGRRCSARAFLQIHHDEAWAKGGADTLDNLRLLCAAHNQWLAEQEYGAWHMKRARAQRAQSGESAQRQERKTRDVMEDEDRSKCKHEIVKGEG